jgi:putative ABC transport system substrate-binding protein
VICSICKGILVALAAIGIGFAHADESRKLPTIGLATPVDRVSAKPYIDAFREGLRNLGYVEGKNVIIIERYANGDRAKLHQIIKEFIARPVDVLFGDASVLMEETKTIPIVSATMGDPVKTGLVASLSHPGGNLTGVSAQSYEVWPKQLELAKELIPNLRHVCLLFDATDEPNSITNANTVFRTWARDVGIAVRTLPVASLDDLRAALKTIQKERPQALFVWLSPLLFQHHHLIMNSVARRMPVIGESREYAEAGALLTFSVDWMDMYTRSAVYVDKILKGAKPGDLPIEQPNKFQLIVNLKVAQALRLKVPESILLRADEVIR